VRSLQAERSGSAEGPWGVRAKGVISLPPWPCPAAVS
jgi:hypothetical protein